MSTQAEPRSVAGAGRQSPLSGLSRLVVSIGLLGLFACANSTEDLRDRGFADVLGLDATVLDSGAVVVGSPDAAVDAAVGRDTDGEDVSSTDPSEAPDSSSLDAQTLGDSGAVVGPTVVRVLTINLKHPLTGLGPAEPRLQMVSDMIVATQPDVVALQEVIRDQGSPSFSERLGQTTGYEWTFEFAYRVPLFFDEGLGILSRWPILSTDVAELPHRDLVIFTRRVHGALIQAPFGDLNMFCTHMTTEADESVKADQALAVFEHVKSHSLRLPGFLAGDTNAEPDSLAMRFLRGDATHERETGDFVDAWLATNPSDAGLTFPSDSPNRRIDYIYAIPGSDGTFLPTRCERLFTLPVNDTYASDHLGVLCDFELR